MSANSNHSTNSLPTSQSFSSLLPKPLYAIQSSSSQPALPPRQHDATPSKIPVKSYLPSQTYQPELQFSLASPSPVSSSVFYQKTPTSKPAIIVQSKTNPSYHNPTTSMADTDMSVHMNMPEPVDMTPPTASKQDTNVVQHQPRSSIIPVVTPYPPTYQRQDSPPISLPLSSNDISHNASYPQKSSSSSNYNTTASSVQQTYNHPASVAHNFSNTPPATQIYNNIPPATQNYSSTPPTTQSFNNTPPATLSYKNTPTAAQSYTSSAPINYNSQTTPPVQQSFNVQHSFTENIMSQQCLSASIRTQQHNLNPSAPDHQSFNATVPTSRYGTPVQQSSYSILPLEKYTQHPSAPAITTTQNSTSISMPLNKQEQEPVNNPYFVKKQSIPVFSNSVLSLKPDEEQPEEQENDDDWDALPTFTKRVHTPPPPQTKSDDESEYDYSDMIYDRRKEEADPFADSFAIPSKVKPLESSIQIIDPTLLSRQLSTKIAVEDATEIEEPAPQNEGITKNDNTVHMYEEKESDEVVKEEKKVRTYEEKESEEIEPRAFLTPFSRPMELTPNYQQQLFFNTPVEEVKVYPTNILRAGAPPRMSATNPYSKKQGGKLHC